jgi:hypothetical protein
MASALLAQTTRGPVPPKSTPAPKSDASATKVETFKSQRGKLIITDTIRVAKLPDIGLGLEIKAIELYEPGKESEKVKGVEFVLHGRSSEFVRVDLEDVPEIQRACSFLYELAKERKNLDEPRAEYVNRSGLSVGIAKIGAGDIQAVLYYQGALVPLPVGSLLTIADALGLATKLLSLP